MVSIEPVTRQDMALARLRMGRSEATAVAAPLPRLSLAGAFEKRNISTQASCATGS